MMTTPRSFTLPLLAIALIAGLAAQLFVDAPSIFGVERAASAAQVSRPR